MYLATNTKVFLAIYHVIISLLFGNQLGDDSTRMELMSMSVLQIGKYHQNLKDRFVKIHLPKFFLDRQGDLRFIILFHGE